MADSLESLIGRKPLHPAEREEAPCTVCVTGAAGYIASKIICRLLAAGHIVHATYRDKDDKISLAACKALPGATESIKWYKADLTVPGSFDKAIEGCK